MEPASGGSAGGGAGGGAGAPIEISTLPKLVADIDISGGGPYTRLLLGDVSGDGRLDLVTMQPDNITDNALPHEVVALTAYELDGTRLWQVGTPNPQAEASASDIPAQIYDLDGNETNEVLAVMNGKFRVLTGKTGKETVAYDLPDPDAHDAILIANFSGNARPSDIVLKNRYGKLWAVDNQFNSLFTFTGETGYYPWPFDWNTDGKDELMAGGHFLDSKGTEQWNCVASLDTVVDAVWSGDLDPDANNGPEVILSGGDTVAYSATGIARFRVDTVEAQNLVVGDFRTDLPGLEVAGLDRIDRTANGYDGLFILSASGKVLWKEQRPKGSGWSTIVTMVSDWDGSGRDLILAYSRTGVLPTLYDGEFNVVATLPEENALLMVADVCGDSRQELLAYTDTYVHVYSTSTCSLDSHVTGRPQPQPKSLYNWTRYWGGDAP